MVTNNFEFNLYKATLQISVSFTYIINDYLHNESTKHVKVLLARLSLVSSLVPEKIISQVN